MYEAPSPIHELVGVAVVIFIPGSIEKQRIQQSNTKIKAEKGYTTKR